MSSDSQIHLSDYVKCVHEKLRNESKLYGADNAWKTHCENENNLKKYASAMHKLASTHWENNYKNNLKAISRVNWIYTYCLEYFNTIICLQRAKELDILKTKLKKDFDCLNLAVNRSRQYRLLDVGSCYNPFKSFSCFDILPIDIAPATDEVYRCDFLNVKTRHNLKNSLIVDNVIIELPTNYFNVVVFSLFLEYLPTPSQRLLCCEKALDLLKPEGILCVVTPDSKHVGANAKIMKTWQFLLAKIGFSRIKYEKLPHMHCIVFRKTLNKAISCRWAGLQNENNFYKEMVIPQDFKKISTNKFEKKSENTVCTWDPNIFKEMDIW